jgi:hypothetical protein
MDTLKALSDAITSILGVLGIFLFGYLLLMGAFHRLGKKKWGDWERERRKSMAKPNIELYSKSSTTELPWKDPSLMQGGLTALAIIAILSMYVVLMLLFGAFTGDRTSIGSIAILLGFPIAVVGMFYIPLIIRAYISLHELSWKPFRAFVIINFVCGILTFLVIFLVRSEQLVIYSQIGLLLVVSNSLSYVFGISDGFKDADIETRFPIVDVVLTEGGRFSHLRLYETTDIDYRFIGEDGSEYIIPNDRIVTIVYVPKEQNSNTTLLLNETSKPEEKKK